MACRTNSRCLDCTAPDAAPTRRRKRITAPKRLSEKQSQNLSSTTFLIRCLALSSSFSFQPYRHGLQKCSNSPDTKLSSRSDLLKFDVVLLEHLGQVVLKRNLRSNLRSSETITNVLYV